MSNAREHQSARSAASAESTSESTAGESAAGTRFSSSGPKPPVSASRGGAGGPSASERGFDGLPGGVEVTSASASVVLPAKRKLAGNWAYEAQTRSATTVHASIDKGGIQVWMQPGIHLDVTWPGRDAQISGASIPFGPKAPRVDVRDGGGYGAVPVTGMVSDKLEELLTQGLTGTRLRSPTYDPLHDPDLSGTIQQVATSFARAFEAEGGEKKAAGVGLDDVTARSLGVGLNLNEPIHIGKDIVIPGGQASLTAIGAANLGALADAKTNAARADAVTFDALRLSSDGLDIHVKGKPLVRMQELTFHKGGKVTVERMTPLGKLAEAQRTESTLSAIAGLIALAAGDRSAGDLINNAHDPKIVDGLTAATIEDKLEAALRGLVLKNRGVIGGVDLAAELGIK